MRPPARRSFPGRRRLLEGLAQGAVVVDLGEAQVGEGQPAQPCDRVIGGAGSRRHVEEELAQQRLIHFVHYPARV